mgnify:FL=1
MEEIEVGSLVIFLEEFKGDTIPNVGLVMEIITFDELVGDLYGSEIIWYAVLFGDVDMVVSSEMIILLN